MARKKNWTTRSRTKQCKDCDGKWSLCVRLVGACEICGSTDGLQAHHPIHRGVYYYRHHLENGLCLCASCHMFNREWAAHLSPRNFEERFKEKCPEKYAWWQANRHELHIGERPDYEDIYNHLKAVLDKQKTYKWLKGRLVCAEEIEHE